MRRVDERDGAVREAAQRERQRLNAGLGRRLARVGVAIGLISLAAIVVGLIIPIGMFGFLAAVGLAIGIAALLAFMPRRERIAAAPGRPTCPTARWSSGSIPICTARGARCPRRPRRRSTRSARLCPRSARRSSGSMPRSQRAGRAAADVAASARADRPIRPCAAGVSRRTGRRRQDASTSGWSRRSPPAARRSRDISEKLARADLAAFETQGRFIQSRYGEERIDGVARPGFRGASWPPASIFLNRG